MPRFLMNRTKSKSGRLGAVVPAMQPTVEASRPTDEARSPNERRMIDEALARRPIQKAEGHLEAGRGEEPKKPEPRKTVQNPNRKKIVRGAAGTIEVEGMQNSRPIASDDIVADPLGDDDVLAETEDGEELVEDTNIDDDDDEMAEIEARMAAVKLQQEADAAAGDNKDAGAVDETGGTPPTDPPPAGDVTNDATVKYGCRAPGCDRPPFGSVKGRNAHEKSAHDGFVPPAEA